jgi:hypothetical protein
MNTRIAIIAALLIVCLPVSADFRTIERAYEVPLVEFTVPVTRNGKINIWRCEDCDFESARLTTKTAFRVNKENVSLQEFRKQVFSVRDRDSVTLIIKHHLESDTVTSIAVSL